MITKGDAKEIGREVEAALKAVAERHGLTLEYRGGSFDATMFRPRVAFKSADAGKVDFERFAPSFGLKADDYGRRFACGGHDYVVAGIRPSASAKPVIATRADGKSFVFPADLVRAMLAK